MKKLCICIFALLTALSCVSCAAKETPEEEKSFGGVFSAFPFYDCGGELVSCEYSETSMTRVYSPVPEEKHGDYSKILRENGFEGDKTLFYKMEDGARYFFSLDSYEKDGAMQMTWYVYSGQQQAGEPTLDSIGAVAKSA